MCDIITTRKYRKGVNYFQASIRNNCAINIFKRKLIRYRCYVTDLLI